MSFQALTFDYRAKADRACVVTLKPAPALPLVAGVWSEWTPVALPIDPKSVPEFRPVDFGFVATITPDQRLSVQRETRIGTGPVAADSATLYGRTWRSITWATPTSVTLASLADDLLAIPIAPFTGPRPKRFILATGVHFGPDRSVELVETCANILWQLGFNCAVLGGASWDSDLGRMVAQAYQAVGFTQTALSTFYLNKGRGGHQGFSFDSDGIEWPQANPALTAWPAQQAADLAAGGWLNPAACVLQLFHDEMGFSHAGLREFRIFASDGDKQRWVQYLQACGHTLQDLGAASWTWTDDVDEVGPTYRSSVVGPHGAAPLAARIRYYRSARFLPHAAAEQSAKIVAAIRATFPGARVASNFNQIAYAIAGKAQGEVFKTADNILLKPIWPEMGAAGVMPWPGLWLNDQSAQDYNYLGARASSAANGGEIGGYLIWRETGDIPGALAQKALALIVHGAKTIYLWTAGHWANQLDNGGLGFDNNRAIPNIQHMAALIGKAEDVLYDGVRVPAQVACLEPSPASYLFERIDEPTPSGLASTRWLAEHMHTYTVLREACINVAILNADQIRQGALEQVRVLYVHDPCVSADVQAIISAWVAAGNVLVTTACAASRDEYDSPCDVLNSRRGILSRAGSGWELDAATLATGKKVTSAVAALPSITGPQVKEGLRFAPKVGKLGKRIKVLATFADGSPAVIDRVSGAKTRRGHCLHFATLPAHMARGVKPAAAAAAAMWVRYPVLTLAKVKPLVTCSVPKVEVSVLKLLDGYALVLHNWNWQMKQAARQVTVTLHVPGAGATATSAERGSLTTVKSASAVSVSLPIGPCDVVTIRTP